MNPYSHIFIKAGDKILPFVIPVTVYEYDLKHCRIEPSVSHLSINQVNSALDNCNTESILYSNEIKYDGKFYNFSNKEKEYNCILLKSRLQDRKLYLCYMSSQVSDAKSL